MRKKPNEHAECVWTDELWDGINRLDREIRQLRAAVDDAERGLAARVALLEARREERRKAEHKIRKGSDEN